MAKRRDPKLIAVIEDADARLQRFGIDDRLQIKFRKTAEPDWLGQYRSFSQFRSGPIFWVNEAAHVDQPDVRKALVQTILHEYGHVIWEYARMRDPALYDLVTTIAGDDEEEFAETFAIVVYNDAASPAYRDVVRHYVKALRA
jgi:hypothetical protein